MSKWDKLIERILDLSDDLRFEELTKVLKHYGYALKQPKRGSSHYTFRKAGASPITLVKDVPIKKVYVKEVRKIVMEENNEKD